LCCPLYRPNRPRMATTTHPLSPMSHRNCPTQHHSCPMLYRDCPTQIHSCPTLYRDCPTQHRSYPMQHFLPQGVIRRCPRSNRPRAYLKVVPQVPDRPSLLHARQCIASVGWRQLRRAVQGAAPPHSPTAGDGSSARLGRFGPATRCARSIFPRAGHRNFDRASGIGLARAVGRE
jgi:hypothetical protein